MGRNASRKDIDQLAKRAKKQGWIIEITRGCHYRWVNPEGQVYHSPYSPSDWRGLLNLKSALRKMGLKLDE